MKTIKYSIIFLAMISVTAFFGCKEQETDEHGHAAGTHAESGEKDVHAEGEAEGEHEELAEDIVELNADQIKMAGVQLGTIEMRQVSGTVKANGLVVSAPQNTASLTFSKTTWKQKVNSNLPRQSTNATTNCIKRMFTHRKTCSKQRLNTAA